MDTICFFNNKGGVGKTTLLCNVASYIAETYDLKVVLVDADPQCNATQLVLDEDSLEALYSTSRPPHSASTILDVLRPLNRGEPKIASIFRLIPGRATRFSFDLLPGHPRLALLEDRLSQAWVSFSAGDLGAARQTNWTTQLVKHLTKRNYDLALFDVGPSLGALNRSVLVGTDFFVTPMGCDIFSIVGIDNISTWLRDWLDTYKQALSQCKRKGWGPELARNYVREDLKNIARFAGYTVQQYIAKVESGKRRPTFQFERIRKKVPDAVRSSLSKLLAPHLHIDQMELGDVPNMFSLVPMAQSAHAPIHRLDNNDGLVGAQYSQRDKYAGFVSALSTSLLKNLNYHL